MKNFLIITLIICLICSLPFLGGSMVWALGGADDLDINGISQLNDRPTQTIQVRDGWTEYGGDAGGNARLGTKPGDFLVAFALPDQ